jgi:hypothetical protein
MSGRKQRNTSGLVLAVQELKPLEIIKSYITYSTDRKDIVCAYQKAVVLNIANGYSDVEDYLRSLLSR